MGRIDAKLRRVNAFLAALLALFFFAHAVMGAASQMGCKAAAPTTLVWALAAVGVAHAVTCVATSYLMLTDAVRPPSKKKRGHLWLKWATGALLLVVVGAHAFGSFDAQGVAEKVVLLATLATLAWHSFVGCKSIVRDLGIPRAMKQVLRVAVVAVSAVVAAMVALG